MDCFALKESYSCYFSSVFRQTTVTVTRSSPDQEQVVAVQVPPPEPFEYYDAGNHWCRNCNVTSGSMFDFFTHLHSKTHRKVCGRFFILVLRVGSLTSTPAESLQSMFLHTSSSPPLVSLDSGPLRQALGVQHYNQNCKECGLRGEADQTSQRYCDLGSVLLLAYHPSVEALNAVASCICRWSSVDLCFS